MLTRSLVTLTLGLLTWSTVTAQAKSDAALRAMYIINFTKYTMWPDGTIQDTLTITVLNDMEVAAELFKTSETLKIQGRNFKVESIDDLDALPEETQVLYCTKSSGVDSKKLFQAIGVSPILLVTEGYEDKNTMLNLIPIGDQLKYAINLININKQLLTVSNTLENLASNVIR